MNTSSVPRSPMRLRVAALILLLLLLAAASRAGAAEGTLAVAWAAAEAETVLHAGDYTLRGAAAAPAAPAAGGAYAVVGASAHAPLLYATRVRLATSPEGCAPSTTIRVAAGATVALCLQVENGGRTLLTHHRVVAPALGINQVVSLPLPAGGAIQITPAQIPGLAFAAAADAALRVDVVSYAGAPAPQSHFAAAALAAALEVGQAAPSLYLPLVKGRP